MFDNLGEVKNGHININKRKYTVLQSYNLFSICHIIDLFLSVKDIWFITKTNSFYGRKAEFRDMLLKYYTENLEPEYHEYIYVIGKFEREILPMFQEFYVDQLLPTKEDDERAERKAQIINILKQAGTEQANFSCQSTVEKYANKIMEVVE